MTSYVYDALNRVTQRSYSTPNGTPGVGVLANYQATPNVSYFYDDVNVPFSKGRLTKVTSSISETRYNAFDNLGRVLSSSQVTDGQMYNFTYTYNLSGALIEQTYPSGRVVKNVLESDGDLSMVQSKKTANSGFFNYAKHFTYAASGAVTSMRLGNGLWESTQFNARLQPVQIGLGTSETDQGLLKLNYDYGMTDNNGNVKSQTITVPSVGANNGFTATQTYSYDSLNRLKSAIENVTPHGGSAVQSWKQTYTFDRYGNRRFDFANGNTTFPDPNCPEAICNPTISTANNRLSSTGWQYDAAGNTTADPEGRTFIYDGENKQTEVRDQYNTVIGQYFFDGDEKRVKKIVPGTGEVTIFVYDAGAKLIAEYSTVVESVENAKVNYLTTDYLGSSRTNTDESGNVTARHDYYPFGQEISTPQRTTGLDTVRRRFTVYQRDEESPDLDYANLRRYSNHIGRFYSADPVAPDIYSPATHNRFQYCLNNPLRFIDSGGGYEEDVHRDLTAALAVVVGFSEAQGNVIGNANQWLDDPESGLGAMPTDSLLDFGYRNRVNWHFTTEGRRYHLWGQFEGIAMRGSGDAALAALGTYLHAQQDSFSHEGFNALLGQGTALPDNWDWQHPLDSLKKAYDEMAKYDKTTFDPEKAVRMARDTLAKLLAARNALVASGRLTALRRPIPWENDRFINDKLLEWAKTEGRNEKRQILFEIMRYAVNYGKPAGASGQLKRRKKKTKTEVKVLDDE